MNERDELVAHLRRTPGWPRLGNAAADQIERDGREIERLTAENERLRYYFRAILENDDVRFTWPREMAKEALNGEGE